MPKFVVSGSPCNDGVKALIEFHRKYQLGDIFLFSSQKGHIQNRAKSVIPPFSFIRKSLSSDHGILPYGGVDWILHGTFFLRATKKIVIYLTSQILILFLLKLHLLVV
jgi:hypothetical protein